jgi:threonine dehydrogenase-like Zn-dependent dehydrogenase
MRALVAAGAPGRVELRDAPEPVPGTDQILVDVRELRRSASGSVQEVEGIL